MKTWETPKLIVLVRNNPQETVLDICKGSPALAAGPVPSDIYMGCKEPTPTAQVLCLDCFSIAAS